MSDAPSNLPFDPHDEGSLAPPVPMAEPILPPARPVAPPPPMPPSAPVPPMPLMAPTAPVVPPSVLRDVHETGTIAPNPSSAPRAIEDVFAGIETPPVQAPAAPRAEPPLPPPVSGGHHTGLLLVVLGFVLVAGAGGATWWYFFRPVATPPVVQDVARPAELPILPPPAQEPTIFTNDGGGDTGIQVVPLPEPVTTPPAGTSIPLPGAPVIPTAPDPSTSTTSAAAPSDPVVQFDTDGDGLTDSREQELGTNPARFDTDGDTLGDGQEVMTYGTNPLNADTDTDGFPDGVEIQNGFNPRGTGRCSTPDCRL